MDAGSQAYGVRLISDEIYHGLHYGRPIATAASFSASAIVINSFSKYFSMTGWRVGWMALPEDLRRPVERLAQNMFISAPHVAQIAAEAAFDCGEELEGNVARYRRSRDHLLAGLPAAGFEDIAAADGAFYLYADVGRRTNDSEAFCVRMLAEAGVCGEPGAGFRPGSGRADGAVQLLRSGGGHARGGGPAGGLECARNGDLTRVFCAPVLATFMIAALRAWARNGVLGRRGGVRPKLS